MTAQSAAAGNAGPKVRSDCRVEIVLTEKGVVEIDIASKVKSLYGESIESLCREILGFYGISSADVKIDDYGAFDYVIAARIEAALRKLGKAEKPWLPEWLYEVPESPRERNRRSRLYLPGDQPKLSINAAIHRPDGLILDLEDSVAPSKKEEARILVRNTLRSLDFMGAERMVRINQLPAGLEDLDEIIPQKADLILIPKVETVEEIRKVDERIAEILGKEGSSRDVWLMPIIESAAGILESPAIAKSSDRIVSLAIGLEDYTADIGTSRTSEGKESIWARSMLVNASKAAGIQPIDTVYSDVSDMDGLRESVLEAKGLGFEGKGCIHPRQIPVVNEAFAPTQKETVKAARIVMAFEDAERKGKGVVSLGSKMIDPPVVKRALKTVQMALEAGILKEEWRDEYAD